MVMVARVSHSPVVSQQVCSDQTGVRDTGLQVRSGSEPGLNWVCICSVWGQAEGHLPCSRSWSSGRGPKQPRLKAAPEGSGAGQPWLWPPPAVPGSLSPRSPRSPRSLRSPRSPRNSPGVLSLAPHTKPS